MRGFEKGSAYVARNRAATEIIRTDLDAAQVPASVSTIPPQHNLNRCERVLKGEGFYLLLRGLSADPRRGRGREAAHASRYRTLSFCVVYGCERMRVEFDGSVNAYGGGDGGGGVGGLEGGPPHGQLWNP